MNLSYNLGKEADYHHFTLVDHSLRLPRNNFKKPKSLNREQRAVLAIDPPPQRQHESEQRFLSSKHNDKDGRRVLTISPYQHPISGTSAKYPAAKNRAGSHKTPERNIVARRYIEACEESQRTTVKYEEMRCRRILMFHLEELIRYGVYRDSADRTEYSSASVGDGDQQHDNSVKNHSPGNEQLESTSLVKSLHRADQLDELPSNLSPIKRRVSTTNASTHDASPSNNVEQEHDLRQAIIEKLLEDALNLDDLADLDMEGVAGYSEPHQGNLHQSSHTVGELNEHKDREEVLSLPHDITFGSPLLPGSSVLPSTPLESCRPGPCGCYDATTMRLCRDNITLDIIDEVMNLYSEWTQHIEVIPNSRSPNSQETNHYRPESNPLGELATRQPPKKIAEIPREDEESKECFC